ncbi:hypothetical protein D3C86_1946100 [compost metagenome]
MDNPLQHLDLAGGGGQVQGNLVFLRPGLLGGPALADVLRGAPQHCAVRRSMRVADQVQPAPASAPRPVRALELERLAILQGCPHPFPQHGAMAGVDRLEQRFRSRLVAAQA